MKPFSQKIYYPYTNVSDSWLEKFITLDKPKNQEINIINKEFEEFRHLFFKHGFGRVDFQHYMNIVKAYIDPSLFENLKKLSNCSSFSTKNLDNFLRISSAFSFPFNSYFLSTLFELIYGIT